MEWVVDSIGLDTGIAGNSHQNGVVGLDTFHLVTVTGAIPTWIRVDIRFLHQITAVHLWDDSNADSDLKVSNLFC